MDRSAPSGLKRQPICRWSEACVEIERRKAMKVSTHAKLAIVFATGALVTTALSAPAQAFDRDHDRDQDRSHSYTRGTTEYNRSYQNSRNYQYSRYRSYRTPSAPPFAYIGASDQARYAYARRHHHRRRHHH
jgi:hypothetical protein